MGNVLLVPVHLDALCLKTDLSVVEAQVDFSRLPYWDGKCEINHDVANISEELLARPEEMCHRAIDYVLKKNAELYKWLA